MDTRFRRRSRRARATGQGLSCRGLSDDREALRLHVAPARTRRTYVPLASGLTSTCTFGARGSVYGRGIADCDGFGNGARSSKASGAPLVYPSRTIYRQQHLLRIPGTPQYRVHHANEIGNMNHFPSHPSRLPVSASSLRNHRGAACHPSSSMPGRDTLSFFSSTLRTLNM